jgi:hypothetical protein
VGLLTRSLGWVSGWHGRSGFNRRSGTGPEFLGWGESGVDPRSALVAGVEGMGRADWGRIRAEGVVEGARGAPVAIKKCVGAGALLF